MPVRLSAPVELVARGVNVPLRLTSMRRKRQTKQMISQSASHAERTTRSSAPPSFTSPIRDVSLTPPATDALIPNQTNDTTVASA